MEELETLLNDAMKKFETKIEKDENLKNDLTGTTRSFHIDVMEQEGFSFMLDNCKIKDFKRGGIEEPDIRLTATEEDFVALFSGELKPMKAWATKRLKVKASLSDLMKLKKLF